MKGNARGDGREVAKGHLFVILVAAALVRVAYLLAYRTGDPLYAELLHDAKRYHDWALALSLGESFEVGAFSQAPLYPYLLGGLFRLFGPAPGAAYLGQLVLGLATIAGVFRVTRRAFGSNTADLAAGMAALFAPFVFYETKLLPVSLATFLTILALDRLQIAVECQRTWGWLAAGLSLGLAAITSAVLLPLLALSALWLLTRRPATSVLLLLGSAIPILPVTARNALVSGEFVLVSTQGGITFYQGNNPDARGVYSTPDGFSGSIFKQQDEARRLARGEAAGALTDSEISSFWFRKGLTFLLQDPVGGTVLLARKLLLSLDDRDQPLEYHFALDTNPVRKLMPFTFALALGLAVACGVTRFKASSAAIPPLLSLIATLVTLLAFYVSGRYRLPAVPALLVFAGGGASAIGERWSTRGPKAAALPVAAAFTAVLVSAVLLPYLHRDLSAQQDTMGLADRAGAFARTGRLDEAVALYDAAIAKDPTYAYAYLDRAKALSSRGERARSEADIRKALALAPGLAEGWFDLGVLCFEADRLEEALAAFNEAFHLDPGSGEAGNNLLGTALRLGRSDKAEDAYRRLRESGLPVDPPLERRMAGEGP